MSATALDALTVAADRLDLVLADVKSAGDALEGISVRLSDATSELGVQADYVRSQVVRVRDSLASAGA